MPSKFGDIVYSIREVISLRILKMTPPELKTAGKISKKWKRCDVRKKILSSREKFGAVLRQMSWRKKKTNKKNIAK